jgi:hypothetical protein
MPTRSEVIASLIDKYNAQITDTESAVVETAVMKLAIAQLVDAAFSGGGGGGTTIATVSDGIDASVDINTILTRLATIATNTTAIVVTSYDQAETQTAAIGTNWTALASGATKNITVLNRTGTSIDIRKVGGSVFFTMVDGDDVPLPVLANSNEWEIKRTDNSNAQVVVKFLRFA